MQIRKCFPSRIKVFSIIYACTVIPDLKDKIQRTVFDGGERLYIDENSSITIYFTGKISIEYAGSCNEYEDIFAAGGCGEFASQNIFEDKRKVMLA